MSCAVQQHLSAAAPCACPDTACVNHAPIAADVGHAVHYMLNSGGLTAWVDKASALGLVTAALCHDVVREGAALLHACVLQRRSNNQPAHSIERGC